MIFSKIVGADFFYSEKQVFQAFKKFGRHNFAENAYMKRMKH